MREETTGINAALSDVLNGARIEQRLTIVQVAEITGLSKWTLQKKYDRKLPINATDLVAMARAVNADPVDVLERALKRADD